jgi:hypothetical protein
LVPAGCKEAVLRGPWRAAEKEAAVLLAVVCMQLNPCRAEGGAATVYLVTTRNHSYVGSSGAIRRYQRGEMLAAPVARFNQYLVEMREKDTQRRSMKCKAMCKSAAAELGYCVVAVGGLTWCRAMEAALIRCRQPDLNRTQRGSRVHTWCALETADAKGRGRPPKWRRQAGGHDDSLPHVVEKSVRVVCREDGNTYHMQL